MSAAVVAILAAATIGHPSPVRAADPLAACVDGFDLVETVPMMLAADVHAASGSKALVAGSGLLSYGRWGARIGRFDRDGWKTLVTKALAERAGFVAIDGSRQKGYWAVGYRRDDTALLPLAMQQNRRGGWSVRKTPLDGSESAALTDVAVRRRDAAWAVGYRLDGPGSYRPLVLRWDGRRWAPAGRPLAAGERGYLTAVSSSSSGGTWVAGSITRGQAERPFIARREQGRWKRLRLPSVGAGSISSIMVHGKRAGWAVGYRLTPAGMRPLVLRWNGRAWSKHESLATTGEALLLDVGLDGGTIALVGSEWHSDSARMRPFVARRSGGAWSVGRLAGFGSDAMVTAAGGITTGHGYVVARDFGSSALARMCVPAPGPRIAGRRAVRQERRLELRAGARGGEVAHEPEPLPPPRTGLAAAPRLRVSARGAAGVRIVDRTEAAGLPARGHTYGAVVRDFDGDGRDDIFIGGHGDEAVLYLNHDGSFRRAGVDFGRVDRHGCTASDVDRSGLPDLYCTLGAAGGSAIKANELWLDPGGPSPRLADDAGGVRELLGRGRVADVFDFDGDGRKDLVLGQTPGRSDGLPSLNRVYRWTAPGRFAPVLASGIAPAVGARAFDVADFDHDGRVDLLMVSYDPMTEWPLATLHLYRNTPKGLKDVRAAWGVKSISERDAELVGLDGDDLHDLVQLSANRLRVSLQRNGRFDRVFERKLSLARDLAVGDADGDGDMDIFILRHKPSPDQRDLILFNDGTGRSFTAVEAPSRAGGGADQVYAIDHDGNGMTDFVALNGRSQEPGPIQLIAFYP